MVETQLRRRMGWCRAKVISRSWRGREFGREWAFMRGSVVASSLEEDSQSTPTVRELPVGEPSQNDFAGLRGLFCCTSPFSISAWLSTHNCLSWRTIKH